MRRLGLPVLASALLLAGLAAPAARAVEAPPGASSCTGCHAAGKGTDSHIPPIVGHSAADVARMLRDFRSGAVPSTVMGRIAKGFDDQQIDALAAWFAKQPE
jgi:cytochrome c553